MKKYIGIDLGTSGAKLLLIDEEANILNEVTKNYNLDTPHTNWSEQNPNEWWEQVLLGLKEIVSILDDKKIDGISFSGQMHGLVILDKNDDVIRPCILWNDGRSEDETKYLNEIIGKEKLSEYTGNIAFPGFTAPKLLWMKKHEPEFFSRISKIMLPKDYLVFRFTGHHVTDYSDASGTLLLDVENKRWSKEMCDICSIDISQLPILHESYDFIEYMKEDISSIIGLSNKPKIIIGAADNAASAIGTGTIGIGKCNISLGTSGTILISNPNFNVDDKNLLHSFGHADGNFYQMGCILSAASCNKWWIEEVLFETDYKKIENEIELIDTNDIIFLPYFNGERCPHNDVNIRGGFFGLSSNTTKNQMSKAILEGVSFALKDCLEIALSNDINISSVTLCGGGARNKIWCQIIADVLNLPVFTLKNDYGASFGACLIALKGCNKELEFEQLINKYVHFSNQYIPNVIQVLKYQKKYKVFKQFYPLLTKIVRNKD